MSGIYKITNLVNGHSYIGKSNNIDRRWKDHHRLAFTSGHKEYNKSLYVAFRKYGLENFEFEILENIEANQYDQISSEREQYWINYYNSYYDGYNETIGGECGSTKGHCSGVANGRAKLSIQDIINIRCDFQQGMARRDSYKKYQDKIGEAAFGKIWTGKTYQSIMPEVYTTENIARNLKLGLHTMTEERARSYHKLTLEQEKAIFDRKEKGEKPGTVYSDYRHIVSRTTFDRYWYNRH